MRLRLIAALAFAGTATAVLAGPPYLTDDPAPTDTGHWEVYGFGAGERIRSGFDGDAGFDLNYGPAKAVQLTATVPLSFSHEPGEGWRSGTGDLEVAVKYRFLDDEKHGISAAVFPRAIFATSSLDAGGKTRLLLPIWLQKDFPGGTSVFGGGGYELNSGPGNRNFWQAGVAATHDFSDRLSLGAEITRQGADSVNGRAQTRAGAGAIVKLSDHYALLASGGPTWAEHRTGFHFYAALGLFF